LASTIEGRNPVLEALRAGRRINKIYLLKSAEKHGSISEIINLAVARHIPVDYLDRPALDRLSNTAVNQGVIAEAEPRAYAALDELLEVPQKKGEPPFFIILDGIEDPHNLGAILRTAEAAGVHGVIIREKRAVGLTPAVEKAAAGALEYVPVARVTNISQTIAYLKQRNIWVVGVDRSGDSNYTRVDYKPPTALVIGGEGQGVSELVKRNCDFLVTIPMRGKISSLNASVAAAMTIFEVVRPRM
jgi:23S rRNA (guanosine2251-2'-O)-methyltransferase